MPTQITLYPGAFTCPELTEELEAILAGLLVVPGKVSESLVGAIEVNIYQENLTDFEEGPFILMEGFVDFAKRFNARFPDFVFYASLDNRFYLDYLTALSGDVTAVQKGDQGRIVLQDPVRFFELAESEISRFGCFCIERSSVCEHVRKVHQVDLAEYLNPQAI